MVFDLDLFLEQATFNVLSTYDLVGSEKEGMYTDSLIVFPPRDYTHYQKEDDLKNLKIVRSALSKQALKKTGLPPSLGC